MNRTDRLLAIVLELQSRGRQRAEDLAATFETSKRTIYRDVQALSEAGVPLISIPGQGYSLMEGYFLPPLSFTTEEATILLLGSSFMAGNFDAHYRKAAQSASRKIEGVLPEQLRGEVHSLRERIQFVPPIPERNVEEQRKLQQLRRAIIEHAVVRFRYYTRHSSNGAGEQQTREAGPYGLVHYSNTWHLSAYCHLRQEIRNFRLERIEDLELLSQTFQRIEQVKIGANHEARPRTISVRVLFDSKVARWVQESRFYYISSFEEVPEGLLVTLLIRHEDEVVQWLLGWGQQARVLEPASLRQRIHEEFAAALHKYQLLPE